jgi:uncharacterized membrane protein
LQNDADYAPISSADKGAQVTVKDVFGLIVRVAGLALILLALLDGTAAVLHLIGLSSHPESTATKVAAAGACYLLVGVLVVILADPITRLAYGRTKDGVRPHG